MVYRLAHVTMTTVVGARTAGREEGMVKVQLSVPTKDVLVNVREIGGMAHMIPIEPQKLWYINNRIDLHTWNLLYDNQ